MRGVNLEGDDQADRSVHGGPDQAVYAYASEDAAYWSGRLGRELAPGAFGENLTLAGVDVSGARIGERWRIGTVELRVTGPRIPCFKLEAHIGVPGFQKAFLHAGRPARTSRSPRRACCRRATRSRSSTGPDHGVTVALVVEAMWLDRARLGRARARAAGHAAQAGGWYEELQAA